MLGAERCACRQHDGSRGQRGGRQADEASHDLSLPWRFVSRATAPEAWAVVSTSSRLWSAAVDLRDGALDVVAGRCPVIVEIGDDLLHERLGQADGPLPVAEVIVQDGERQLLRARAFVRPLEPPPG